MRSSITIFLLGLVLGSTLGIGGVWTQVVKPAYNQIDQLQQEHGVMESALDEAGKALLEVADELRGKAPEAKPTTQPTANAKSLLKPSVAPQPQPSVAPRPMPAADAGDKRVLATRLEKLAAKIKAARAKAK